MTRSRFARWALAAVLAMGLCATATAQNIDRDTKCGAPATGLKADGSGVAVTLDAVGAQHLRVGPDGVWRFCEQVESRPPAPADCAIPKPLRWTVGEATCEAPGGGTVPHGKRSPAIQSPAGPIGGLVVLQCQNGTLAERVTTCGRTSYCEVTSYRGTDDGEKTFWTFAGRLREGERGTAVLEGGTATRPIECNQGRLSLR